MITIEAPSEALSEAARLPAKTSTLIPELIVESQKSVEKRLSSRLEKNLIVQVETIDDGTDNLTPDQSSSGKETETEGRLRWIWRQ